jgi:hypothetical protein
MEKPGDATARLQEDLLTAQEGRGPLLQRDYWAVLEGCELTPPELMQRVAHHFPAFPPTELVRFHRPDGGEAALAVGDDLEVQIVGAGRAYVRVLHRDANSFTFGTLRGHPEAGRITFGAYRNPRGDVIFHIRSRARSDSRLHLLGFLAAGEPMQTNTWTDFIDRLAHMLARGVRGVIHADTRTIADEPAGDPTLPTFLARGN